MVDVSTTMLTPIKVWKCPLTRHKGASMQQSSTYAALLALDSSRLMAYNPVVHMAVI